MGWIQGHKTVWRVTILVLLLVALLGPWWYDRINVPAEYTCSPPNVRLYGDFCGMPMPGAWIILMMPGALINLLGVLVKGTMTRSDLAGAFLYTGLVSLLVLPFFTTLLLIRRMDRTRWQVFRMMGWGLAAGVGLWSGFQSVQRLDWALWGVWLYVGLTVSALILELLVLVGGRKPDQHNTPQI